jgi:hypothetical protein
MHPSLNQHSGQFLRASGRMQVSALFKDGLVNEKSGINLKRETVLVQEPGVRS